MIESNVPPVKVELATIQSPWEGNVRDAINKSPFSLGDTLVLTQIDIRPGSKKDEWIISGTIRKKVI